MRKRARRPPSTSCCAASTPPKLSFPLSSAFTQAQPGSSPAHAACGAHLDADPAEGARAASLCLGIKGAIDADELPPERGKARAAAVRTALLRARHRLLQTAVE